MWAWIHSWFKGAAAAQHVQFASQLRYLCLQLLELTRPCCTRWARETIASVSTISSWQARDTIGRNRICHSLSNAEGGNAHQLYSQQEFEEYSHTWRAIGRKLAKSHLNLPWKLALLYGTFGCCSTGSNNRICALIAAIYSNVKDSQLGFSIIFDLNYGFRLTCSSCIHMNPGLSK